MDISSNRWRTNRILLLSGLVLGVAALFASQTLWASLISCHETYDLLNPTLPCGDSQRRSEWEYEHMRKSIIAAIAAMENAGMAKHVSVYFRELDNGPRFGVEEYEQFYPASLLKVPDMIAILHAADRQPSLLDETLVSPASLSAVANVEQPEQTIQPNTSYTVRELLQKMIAYSDNDSKNLLVQKLNSMPPPTVRDTFLDLGVMPMMNGSTNYVSIQSYAYLFSVLYNAGYLSKEMSQYALDLLSQSTYEDGLEAGVPANVRVAHKFGYRILPNGEHQLHDCGIIYHPSTSYVLCIMTSGPAIESDASAIAAISRLMYDQITSLHLENR
jgi:beta-lactamase class A